MSSSQKQPQAQPDLDFGYTGPSPIEWRAKEHAKCMASQDFIAAKEWLDEIERELKVARLCLAIAKSCAAEDATVLGL